MHWTKVSLSEESELRVKQAGHANSSKTKHILHKAIKKFDLILMLALQIGSISF